jgi:phosphate transport system substrate-binding protein
MKNSGRQMNMNCRSIRIVFWLFCLFFDGASADALQRFAGKQGVIRIAGGTAHIPVMKEVAARIMRVNPDIQISVAGGGSGVGIKQVGEGLIDIGNSGRRATDEEIARYGLHLYQWAVDGVGVVVNPSNPVRALDRKQLQAVFAGDIANWKELGGADRRINLYTRDDSGGTRAVFWEMALNKGRIAPGAQFVVSNGAMKSAISQDPYGIGYVSVGYMDDSVAPVAFEGMAPTLENVRNGSYRVARGLYSNTRGAASGLVEVFIDYLFTSEGREIISSKGFIPVE